MCVLRAESNRYNYVQLDFCWQSPDYLLVIPFCMYGDDPLFFWAWFPVVVCHLYTGVIHQWLEPNISTAPKTWRKLLINLYVVPDHSFEKMIENKVQYHTTALQESGDQGQKSCDDRKDIPLSQ